MSVFPSFWDSIKYLTVRDGEHSIELKPTKAQLNELKEVRDSWFAANDPQFATRTRRKGLLQILGGIAAIIGGFAMTWFSIKNPSDDGTSMIFYGLWFSGLVLLVKGCVTLQQAKRAAKLSGEDLRRQITM